MNEPITYAPLEALRAIHQALIDDGWMRNAIVSIFSYQRDFDVGDYFVMQAFDISDQTISITRIISKTANEQYSKELSTWHDDAYKLNEKIGKIYDITDVGHAKLPREVNRWISDMNARKPKQPSPIEFDYIIPKDKIESVMKLKAFL